MFGKVGFEPTTSRSSNEVTDGYTAALFIQNIGETIETVLLSLRSIQTELPKGCPLGWI